jgi:orotidine-5'-phosphate decarboxylase
LGPDCRLAPEVSAPEEDRGIENNFEKAKNKLIVALDVDRSRAVELFNTLRDVVSMFKIGSRLFTAAGPEIVRQIIARGGRVFLDLKFHDIPNTVAAAGIEAARLGISIFNVHAAGGSEMMRRTAEKVKEVCDREDLSRPKVIAVTVLTSMDEARLAEVGVRSRVKEQAAMLAQLAADSGLDGAVASPLEVASIREAVQKPGFMIVTPGVRPAASESDDQKRIMTPGGAIHAGADYIVVGRPVIAAPDPVKAARDILEEIKNSSLRRTGPIIS